MQKLREDSQKIDIQPSKYSALISFLYVLMRDYLVPGKVEKIVLDSFSSKIETTHFTNDWLAKYAENIIKRLLNED